MKAVVNGKPIDVEASSAKELAEKLHLNGPDQALATHINGKIADLDASIQNGDCIDFFSFDTPLGKEVFWHTSAHVLAQAILRLFPDAKPTIGPAIEQGFYYDFADLNISDEDFAQIEQEMEKIIDENYPTKRLLFKDKTEAKNRFKSNPFKLELIDGFEGSEISAYEQGEFTDLCRGPHLSKLGKIKAFKLLKTSGAYWKGDVKNPVLTRIYGISFPDRKLLKEYLVLLEEAKKRDHKILGPKLDLFSIQEEAPGIPFIHPRGMAIWNRLVDFLRELLLKFNYIEVKTPQLVAKELWQKSGHWDYYRDGMFAFEVENRSFALKPMNCPEHMLFYKSQLHSYRSLPLRVAEFGHVHRNEFSGAVSGLFRCRSFHQDDAHLFVKPSDIKAELLNILGFVEEVYSIFGLKYRFELSTRPKESMGSDEIWEIATESLKSALQEWGQPFRINEGDGAFYGPKIDIHIQDALGRSWQCGTVQLDMALPEKFDLAYMDKDGISKKPVVIHRAILGSIERFFGILIEHFAGKFPLWISPLPVRVLTIADRHAEYGHEIMRELVKAGFMCDIDETSESMNKKIRNAQLLQINYMLTVGDKELENNTLCLRTRDGVVHGEMKLDSLIEQLRKEKETKSLYASYHH